LAKWLNLNVDFLTADSRLSCFNLKRGLWFFLDQNHAVGFRQRLSLDGKPGHDGGFRNRAIARRHGKAGRVDITPIQELRA